MASTILVKRSATPAKVPTTANLSLGELGLNTYDGALYFKKNVTGVESIVTVSIVGNAEVFTNKTFDTAATGNVFQINGTAISAVSGTGSTVVLSSGPSISNLTLTGTLTAGGSVGTSGQVLQSTGTGVQWASSSASISITDDTSTNSTFYPSFVNTTSGNLTTNYVSSSKLTYNPSTGTLGVTALSSTSLTAPTISTLSLDTGTTGSINLGTGANAKAISLGNSSVASTIALNNNTTLAAGKTVTLSGSTSGTIALQAAAIAGTNTITFPASTGTVALTSGTGDGTLTMGVSGVGLSGSATFTANQSGASTFTVTSNATSANTVSTIVSRDASGGFSAGTITAALSGNATTATSATSATTAGSVTNAATFNNSGTGAASGTTFDGSAARTISYNTLGASPLAGSTSLTTTGTVTTGTWSGLFGAVSGANLTNLTAGNLSGTIPTAVLGNSTLYVGTTAILLNRASASQALTGITSIDGSAASVANALTFSNGGAGDASGTTFNGSAARTISYNSVGASPLAGSSSLVTTGSVTSGTWKSGLDAETYSTSASVSAGTNNQGQGALTSDYNVVTTTTANPSGVTLPVPTTGRRIIVVNKGTNPLNVYPTTGAAIDALGANVAISLAVAGWIEFNASSTTQWYSTAGISTSGTAGSVANSVTFNSGGAGGTSPTTFNGSAAQTISYNTLGASPLAGSSSLTTTGTVTSGTWSGSFGAVSGANLTSLTAGNLSGTIPSTVLGNSTAYVGTTAILLNRASAAQSLTGITSIDGSSASLTTSRTLWGQSFNGTANVTGSLTSVGDITGTGAVNLTATAAALGLVATGANSITASTNGLTRVTIDSSGNTTFTGQVISTRANSTTTGGGQIYLNGATGNRIDFAGVGVAAPAFTTRSVGTKIVLYPSLGASTVDYALGIDNSTFWYSTLDSTTQFKWYAGTTNIATLSGAGVLSIATNGSTLYGPNSTWAEYLRVGGNGNADTTNASVVTSNGNLHLDAKTGAFGTYINYYKGTGGVNFGNGASATVGSVDSSGNSSFRTIASTVATGTAPLTVTSTTQVTNLNSNYLNGITATQFFNNMGNNHSTRTDFNSSTDFGFNYVQGSTNGPGIPSAVQYYNLSIGLGNDYAYSQYAMEFAIPRTPIGGNPYPSVRFREGGTWGSWSKIYAGYADSAGSSTNSTNATTATNLSGGSVAATTGTFSNYLGTLEQVRATGWYGTPTGSSYTGLAVEMGVSGGNGYTLCYNRDTSSYGNFNLAGAATNILLPSSGTTITVTGSISATGSVAGTNITSGGNVTGSSASCTGNAATATSAGGGTNRTFFSAGTASEGQIGAQFTGQNSVYLYNNATAWGIYSGSGGSAFTYTRSSGLFAFNGSSSSCTGNAATATALATASGSAPSYSARAWVNFDGTTASPSTIRGSGNVSSVTKNGTGDYTINFTTAMPDANYAPSVIARRPDNLLNGSWFVQLQNTATQSTSAFQLATIFNPYSTPSLAVDSTGVFVQIFR